MQFAKFIAGAVLCTAASFAAADPVVNNFTIDLSDTSDFGNSFKGAGLTGTSFLDIYTFTIPSTSDLGTSLTSFATKKTYDLDITSFDLYSGTKLVANGTRELTGALDVWSLESLNIASGSYSLRVGGTILGTSGGSYGGNANISPVPEPEAWSMVGLGLAVAGVMARRRRSAHGFAARAA